MASIVVDDPSIGDALSTLGKGLGMANDPKRRAEAMFFQQKLLKAQQEAEDAQALARSRAALADEFAKVQQFERSRIAPEISPEPVGAQMGPLMPIPNPRLGAVDANAGFAREALRTGMLSATNAKDALTGAYLGRGQGQLATGGLPQTEEANRVLATQLSGMLPDANAAYTDSRRRMLAGEASDLKVRESLAGGIKIGQNETFIPSPEQQQTFVLRPGAMQGQVSVGEKETIIRPDGTRVLGAGVQPGGSAAAYAGTGYDQQSASILDAYLAAKQSGAPITPDMQRRAQFAWTQLFGPKEEIRQGPGGGLDKVIINPPVPQGFEPHVFGIGSGAGTTPPAPGNGPQPLPDPATQGAGAIPATGGPPAAMGGAPVPVPQLTAKMPPAASPGAGTQVQTLRPGKPEFPTEHVIKKSQYLSTMQDSAARMGAMLDKGFRPSFIGEVLGPMAQPGGGGLINATQTALMRWGQGQLAPDDQTYITSMVGFLNAVLRDESGAAVPESEYPRYIASLTPAFGDTEQNIAAKRQAMTSAIEARRRGLSLDQIHGLIGVAKPATGYIQGPREENDLPAPGGAPPIAAGGAPPAPGSANPGAGVRRFRVDPATGDIVEVR